MTRISLSATRDLKRKDADRLHLRGLLLDGAASAPAEPVSAAYFELLKKRVRRHARG